MSIRTRLTLSNMAMLVIPLSFSLVLTLILGSMFMQEVRHERTTKFLQQTLGKTNDMGTGALLREIRRITMQNPDKFLDTEYVKDLDMQLNSLNLGLIIRKDDSVQFFSDSVKNQVKEYDLPPFRRPRNDRPPEVSPPRSVDKIGIMDQQDFYFKDNSSGTVFIVSDSSYLKRTVRYATILIISIFVIMILTNIVLTILVSRSIVKPLETLKKAADELKKGNLDFEIKSSARDEIGEVCSAFEDARIKLKESEELKLQYENNRKELISNITHDLKTPVTAIKGYIEGIKDGVADTPEKTEKYIETIYSKANYLDKLIDELFLFSKLDLNKLPFNFERIEIIKYMEDCCDELRFDLEDIGIRLNSNFSNLPSPVYVKGDREKLKRVITNIVGNSAKYMDKVPGEININLTDQEKYIEIGINDNGKGIGSDSIPFIFDRFYREDPARNTLTGGSGLGLAISKLIIEEMGGQIRVESMEGKGTSIFFTLQKLEKGSELYP